MGCGADVGAIALRAVVFGIRAAYPEVDLAELTAQAKIPFQNTGCPSPTQTHVRHVVNGFMLFYVAHDVLNESNKDYKNSWILADMHSEKWADVYELFVRANPDGPKYSKEEVSDALGYPVVGDFETNKIRFTDETETAILRKTVNEKAGPVSGMELSSLYGHDVDWSKVDDYYVKCKAACAEIAVTLSMDVSGCPEFQEYLRSKDSSG
ncbi:hypothetical protein SCUP234_01320 [Seiridium cupressi]